MAKPQDRRATWRFEQAEDDELASRAIASKARLACVEWLGSIARWDLYATLTYDPRRATLVPMREGVPRRPPSPETCSRHFSQYVSTMEKTLSRMVAATGAIESTRAGWPHVHALLALGGVEPPVLVRTIEAWFERHGYARIDRVDQTRLGAVSSYLLKYFTKSNAEVALVGHFQELTGEGQRYLPQPKGQKNVW